MFRSNVRALKKKIIAQAYLHLQSLKIAVVSLVEFFLENLS